VYRYVVFSVQTNLFFHYVVQSKVRTTDYHEIGGGNAANTATAMARLSKAAIFAECPFRVKLCTKVGDDAIGRQLIQELETLAVDITSPLFLVGSSGTTTGLTNVIVSQEEHTRTCIHTPGTCGELTIADIDAVNLDEVFHNVHHLHADCRHTDAALKLAREAKRRGVTVSIDAEKDRNTKALDTLLELADLVFTNAHQIETYLNRLMREFENDNNLKRWKEPDIVAPITSSVLCHTDLDFYSHVVKPSSFFTRWYRQQGKQVVITRGEQGAICVANESITEKRRDGEEAPQSFHRLVVEKTHADVAVIHQTFTDYSKEIPPNSTTVSANYVISTAGILTNIKIVDTTGAGDAFIGGFILLRYVAPPPLFPTTTCLQFASWVGGRKLQGFGARTALPDATDIDTTLGTSNEMIVESLAKLLNPFKSPARSRDASVPLVASWESFDHIDDS